MTTAKEETIEIDLPKKCTVLVFESMETPGTWIIKANICARDVETGDDGYFTTLWQGGKPSRRDVLATLVNMLRHELAEQLGLDPHRKDV